MLSECTYKKNISKKEKIGSRAKTHSSDKINLSRNLPVWEYRSVIEHFPRAAEMVGSIPNNKSKLIY